MNQQYKKFHIEQNQMLTVERRRRYDYIYAYSVRVVSVVGVGGDGNVVERSWSTESVYETWLNQRRSLIFMAKNKM